MSIPLNRPVSDVGVLVQPGSTFVEPFMVPADAAPGQYRLVKPIDLGGSGAEAVATVTVRP